MFVVYDFRDNDYDVNLKECPDLGQFRPKVHNILSTDLLQTWMWVVSLSNKPSNVNPLGKVILWVLWCIYRSYTCSAFLFSINGIGCI